jgi:pimeloyl-ACP methyl ester carboxylesterase
VTPSELFVDHRAVRAGNGAVPRIVFVHGAMDRSSSFAKVRGRLAAYDTVAYDRRGYGRSRPAGPARSFAGHLDDLEAVVGDRPAVLVGHSYGGNLVLALAARRPEVVAATVVFEPPMPWEPWWPDARAGGNTVAIAREHGPTVAAESFMRRVVGDAVWERLGEGTRADRLAEGPAMLVDLAGLREGGRPFDPSDVRAPAVVGLGSRSEPHRRRASIETLLTLGASRPEIRSIGGAGHGAHSSHPDAFAALVERALARALEAPARI